MNSATLFYLVLYGGTLAVHVIFMNYVVGGTAFLAAASICRIFRRSELAPDPIVEKARDWLPFAPGAAITAGVAPLLFLQILYAKPFYTANLLLLHRWMSIVPVLIAGFYLLYLLKSRPFDRPWMPLVAVGAFACVAWTGLAWTENHSLSLESPERWAGFYEAGSMWYRDVRVSVRFALWLSGSLPTFCLLIAWQLHVEQRHAEPFSVRSRERLGQVARGGLLVSVVVAAIYASRLDSAGRGTIETPLGWAAMLAAATGMVAQGIAWSRLRLDEMLKGRRLWIISGAALLTTAAAIVLRELVRLGHWQDRMPVGEHKRAAAIGGFWVFVAFLVLNVVLVAWCLRIGIRSSRRSAASSV